MGAAKTLPTPQHLWYSSLDCSLWMPEHTAPHRSGPEAQESHKELHSHPGQLSIRESKGSHVKGISIPPLTHPPKPASSLNFQIQCQIIFLCV